MPVSVIVCSSPMVCASSMLNANSVPEEARPEINAAAARLAIFVDHVVALSTDIERSRTEFYSHLLKNWSAYTAAADARRDLEVVAYSDGLTYLARLHAILYEFKAFLDLFTRLICRLIGSASPPHGFNKGKVEGREVSGGRLIHWLQGHSTDRLPTRDALVRTLSAATKDWITSTVVLRDTLGHRRDIPGLTHMRVGLTGAPRAVELTQISCPEMPDGRSLPVFVVELRDKLCQLVSDVLQITPRVDPKLNEVWQKARIYLEP